MKNIHLIGIYGLYNFGCEAIVRGTYYLLKKADSDCVIYLHSYTPDYDKNVLKDLDIKVLPIIKKRMNYLLWKINVFLERHNFNYQISSENYNLSKNAIFLSIGGDIYTIPEKFWDSVDYFEYNDLITKGEEILKKNKLIIWGASIGPFGKSKRINDYYFTHLKKVNYILVREKYSYGYLKKNDINNLKLIDDPAFYVISNFDEKTDEYIGMNFSPLSLGEMASENILSSIIRVVVKIFYKYDKKILFIPHVISETNVNDDDYRFLKNIVNLLPVEVRKSIRIVENSNFLDTKKYIRKCKIIIAARMHCAVNAICEGVPTIFLCYSQKGFGMALNIYDNTEFAVRLNELDEKLTDKIDILFDNYNEYQSIIENKLKIIRSKEKDIVDFIRKEIMEES